jgi:predicted translin family RNA/ssDNA-binding protein
MQSLRSGKYVSKRKIPLKIVKLIIQLPKKLTSLSNYSFAVYDNIVSGLSKKLDVARMLIEDIRATVTEKSRRKALIEAVGDFGKRISKEE